MVLRNTDIVKKLTNKMDSSPIVTKTETACPEK